MELKTEFFTDTAEICVFDPLCLKHRLADAADWWTISSEAIKEMNDANVMFVDVGTDATYTLKINIMETSLQKADGVSSLIKCKSGIVFIGPAEETTSDDCEPTDEYGGLFAKLNPANYLIQMLLQQNTIEVIISPTSDEPKNFHNQLLKLSV